MDDDGQQAVVARIVRSLVDTGGESAKACACALQDPMVGEAAASAVTVLREGPPAASEEQAVRAYVAHLLGQSPRRVVYTVGG